MCEFIISQSSLSKTPWQVLKIQKGITQGSADNPTTQFVLPEGGSIIAQRFIGG
jgi:hypothetical protein